MPRTGTARHHETEQGVSPGGIAFLAGRPFHGGDFLQKSVESPDGHWVKVWLGTIGGPDQGDTLREGKMWVDKLLGL